MDPLTIAALVAAAASAAAGAGKAIGDKVEYDKQAPLRYAQNRYGYLLGQGAPGVGQIPNGWGAISGGLGALGGTLSNIKKSQTPSGPAPQFKAGDVDMGEDPSLIASGGGSNAYAALAKMSPDQIRALKQALETTG